MRTSSRKTTAAVARDIIGIKVPEWAEILKCSPYTVHDLESGRLKLSDGMATKMVYETGISFVWLLNGDPGAPPIAHDGRKYTKEIYDELQARNKYMATVSSFSVASYALDCWRDILAILVNANRKKNFYLAFYRTGKVIDELETKFGKASDIDSVEKALTYVEPILPLKPKSKQPLKKKKHRRK